MSKKNLAMNKMMKQNGCRLKRQICKIQILSQLLHLIRTLLLQKHIHFFRTTQAVYSTSQQQRQQNLQIKLAQRKEPAMLLLSN